jgi:hypothetical protein
LPGSIPGCPTAAGSSKGKSDGLISRRFRVRPPAGRHERSPTNDQTGSRQSNTVTGPASLRVKPQTFNLADSGFESWAGHHANPHRARSDGRQAACKDCNSSQARAWSVNRVRDTTQVRPTHKRHHLTKEQVDALIAAQGGVCAICQSAKPDRVDHDHSCCPGGYSCGRCMRGMLCHRCNTALGLMSEDARAIARMVDYLAAFKAADS